MNKYHKLMLITGLGAAAGYAYYHFFGCTNGCPLQSNWYVTTLYGAIVGLTLGFPGKTRKTEQKDEEENN